MRGGKDINLPGAGLTQIFLECLGMIKSYQIQSLKSITHQIVLVWHPPRKPFPTDSTHGNTHAIMDNHGHLWGALFVGNP